MTPLIEAVGLAKHYDLGGAGAFGLGPRTVLRAVDGVDLRVDAGETLGLWARAAAASPRWAAC